MLKSAKNGQNLPLLDQKIPKFWIFPQVPLLIRLATMLKSLFDSIFYNVYFKQLPSYIWQTPSQLINEFGSRAMVSTVQEIEQLKECGISDFLYSVAIVPSKFWLILFTAGKEFPPLIIGWEFCKLTCIFNVDDTTGVDGALFVITIDIV